MAELGQPLSGVAWSILKVRLCSVSARGVAS